jgi:hypothetical protein
VSQRFPNQRSAAIAQGSVGQSLVVAGRPSLKIVVHGLQLTLSAVGTVAFRSGALDKTGAFDIEARGGMVLPPSDRAYFECDPGDDLNVLTTGGVAKGLVQYTWE